MIILLNGAAVGHECGEDLDVEAADRAAALEAEYPAERVKSLVDNGGREPG